jgi:hypothetical protein
VKYALVSLGLGVQVVIAVGLLFGMMRTGFDLSWALMGTAWMTLAIGAPVAWFAMTSVDMPR